MHVCDIQELQSSAKEKKEQKGTERNPRVELCGNQSVIIILHDYHDTSCEKQKKLNFLS